MGGSWVKQVELDDVMQVSEIGLTLADFAETQHDSGLSQIFILIASSIEKKNNSVNVKSEDKIHRKTAHSKVPPAYNLLYVGSGNREAVTNLHIW